MVYIKEKHIKIKNYKIVTTMPTQQVTQTAEQI